MIPRHDVLKDLPFRELGPQPALQLALYDGRSLALTTAFCQGEVLKGSFQKLQCLVLQAHDLALSKLSRNSDVDMEDVKYLASTVPLDLELLRGRYLDEVRPYLAGRPERGDLTLDLWCEAIKEELVLPIC